MAYTLVVIDMQPYFTSYIHAIFGVEAAIKRAKKSGCPIIFVEYSPEIYGKTDKKLKSMTEKYSKTFFVKKTQVNGGKEIINAIRKHKLPARIRVCGVETGCCVLNSLKQICDEKSILPKEITLLTKATSNHPLTFVPFDKAISQLKSLGVQTV
jgi:nicotinamidase-related amidase